MASAVYFWIFLNAHVKLCRVTREKNPKFTKKATYPLKTNGWGKPLTAIRPRYVFLSAQEKAKGIDQASDR